jgi:hypothetical protein
VAGLKDIGIKEGTFTFLTGVVVVDVDCRAVELGMGGVDEAGVGTVESWLLVVGGTNGPGDVGCADVV